MRKAGAFAIVVLVICLGIPIACKLAWWFDIFIALILGKLA